MYGNQIYVFLPDIEKLHIFDTGNGRQVVKNYIRKEGKPIKIGAKDMKYTEQTNDLSASHALLHDVIKELYHRKRESEAKHLIATVINTFNIKHLVYCDESFLEFEIDERANDLYLNP
jgi:hypothetical protein